MSHLNQLPILRFLIPLIAGIVVAVYFPSQNPLQFYVFGSLFLLFGISLIIKPLNSNFAFRWFFGVLIYFLFFNLGYGLTNNQSLKATHNLSSLNEQVVIGEIAEPPVVKDKIVKCVLSITGTKQQENWQATKGKTIVFLQKDNESEKLTVGDVISFQPEFKDVPTTKNPLEFDYKKYLSFHLINQQAFLKSLNWKLLDKPDKNNIFVLADVIRRKMIFTLEKLGLTNNELGVASALILGYKNNIEAQLKSAYSSAGAMHVLAVSGLHVGIIFMIFNVLLKFTEKFKYGGIIKGIILLLVLWFYALITGLSPSVLRSATMFSFVVAAKMINRRTNFFNTLSASALLLLLVNPFLIFDVGFQLSYSAVIGIVLIQPWFSKWLSPTTWLGNYTWDLVTVSLAAQIATFPLGLYYFHQFPNYFLLANLLVIPFAVIILCLGLFTLAASFIPVLSVYIGMGLKWTIFGLNWVVTYIDQLPYAVTNKIKFTLSDTIFVYLIIGFILLLFVYRKFYYFALASITTLMLLTTIGFDKFKLLNQKKLIVYNIPKHTAINFIDGNDNILISDIMLSKDKLKFHVENNWIDKGIEAEKVVNLENLKKEHLISNLYKIDNRNLFTKRNYFQYYNHKIAIIDKNFRAFIPQEKLNVDFIIWTQNCKIPLEKLIQIFQFKKLIIDSSNSTYVNDKLVNEAKQLKMDYWSVQENGAFEIDV